MKDSKLIKMLKTFSVTELAEFEKFVDSPYFSRGRNLSEFFKCLKPFSPDFESKDLTSENIFLKLYPGKTSEVKSSDNIIHKLSSETYKLCKEFLIQIELNKDENRRYFYLLNQLRMKKLYNEFEKEYKISQSLDENFFKGSVNYFMDKYFLCHSYLEYNIDKCDFGNTFENILLLGEYSAAISLIKGFRNIDTNNSSEKFNVKVRYNLVDNFINHLNSDKLIEEMKMNKDSFYPYVAVSHGIYKMFTNPDNDEYYYRFKNLVNEHLELFGHSEKYILFQTMIGYCIRKHNEENQRQFVREEFQIIKEIFKLGIYKYNESDKIQINSFRTIVISAVDNGDIEWLEDFVNRYIGELHIEHRESMKYFSFAYINFEKNEFEKALEYIMKVKYEFFLFKLDVKNLMFKIYFELDYTEQAYSLLDTMRHYLSNAKDLSESIIARERNFIKYASELLKLKSESKILNSNYLKDKLENERYLEGRKWLLQKIDS